MSPQDRLKYVDHVNNPFFPGGMPPSEAATHIEQDLLALIGEDETGEDLNPNDMDDELVRLFRNKRNDLRAELRTAITAYCKGEK